MSARLLFIGLMVFLGVCFTAIALWLRISLKKSSAYGMPVFRRSTMKVPTF